MGKWCPRNLVPHEGSQGWSWKTQQAELALSVIAGSPLRILGLSVSPSPGSLVPSPPFQEVLLWGPWVSLFLLLSWFTHALSPPPQGTHKSLKGNSHALSTVTAIIDGTGSVGA